MTAHDAAVEAMAAALHAKRLGCRTPGCGPNDADDDLARQALAALVRSEAVRAALVAALMTAWLDADPGFSWPHAGETTDAILAALRPDDEGGAK